MTCKKDALKLNSYITKQHRAKREIFVLLVVRVMVGVLNCVAMVYGEQFAVMISGMTVTLV